MSFYVIQTWHYEDKKEYSYIFRNKKIKRLTATSSHTGFEIVYQGMYNLTSWRNVESTWRVFRDIHLAWMFRVSIGDRGVLNISYDNGIPIGIQEVSALRIAA